jgi:predicted phosphodiesterase
VKETLRLTERDVPDGSVIGVLSDIHIPHHDEDATKLAVECLEAAGCTHVLLNGDIGDCGPASRHEGKRKRAVLDEGCLKESVAAGLWIYEWARTRPCIYTRGNHEAWVENYIDQSAELKGTSPESLMGLWEDGDGWTVLSSMSRVRLGSRCWEHGDGIFKSGNGGANPGARIKALAPDQTTSIGHLHRKGSFFWSSEDENGVPRTRGAYLNGHLSRPEAHEDYMGSYLSWQQSFEITRVYYIDGRPRFTTSQPEIHRDKRNRPYLEHEGRVFR